MKKDLWTAVGAAAAVFLAVLAVALWPSATRTIAIVSDSDSQALVDKGRYLGVWAAEAQARDC